MIEFCNVSVCYDPGARHPATAIENLSLNIKAGEWVFLVGPSGAGKSTLLKLLHCGVPASARVEGRVLLNGQNLTHLSSHEVPFVRRKIGVVFQDFQLLAQKTAWENIAFALRVIGEKQSRIAREVPRALDIVGLAHRAHAQPHELSGGEQQRIAIARAIVNNPPLLLCDEPTGNLDPQTAADLAEVLCRVNEERGTTVIMATHDRHLVDTLRKRVVRVRDGKIAGDEAQGVYHPEDDVPVGSLSSSNGPAAMEEPQTEARKSEAPKTYEPKTVAPRARIQVVQDVSTPEENAPASSTPPAPRVRVITPQDAITQEALNKAAPMGTDENPIVQYGRE